ncbi:MAG: hypothetical protein ISR65_02245 [Bacteriovoracaceae bacterium]|nr:hypothetical protein [Bacteriovoracaceae bacterium]
MNNLYPTYKLVRTAVSTYQGPNFLNKEMEALNTIDRLIHQGGLVANSKLSDACDIVITTTNTDFLKLKKTVDLSNLKLLIQPNSGHDNIPKSLVENATFPVIVGNPIRAQAVATYILEALIHHFCPITKRSTWDKSRKWDRDLIDSKKILLIGFGHIGQIVFNSLRPLNSNIYIYDPFKDYSHWPCNKFDALILCASLNPSSHHIINEQSLSHLLNPQALIINSARGPLIDEQALVRFLEANPLSYAYCDVFKNEPYDFQKLKHLTNICMTSHIAGVFNGINDSIINFEKQVIEKFIRFERNLEQFKEFYAHLLLQNRLVDNYLI